MNQKWIAATQGKPQTTPPVWMMRQAGRYHRHYQNLRSKNSFIELCKTPELAAEVAMGPIQDFDFDVAILFSDLLFPLEGLGMGLSYEPAPTLGWHLKPDNFNQLKPWQEALKALEFQKAAMQMTRSRLPKGKSLIGFVGGPLTLFTYAVEGAHKGSLQETKRMLTLFPKFCEIMVPLLIENIRLQFEGGAEAVMVFDTAAGELSPYLFSQLVVPELKKMAEAFSGRLGYYSKGTTWSHIDCDGPSGSLVKLPWAGMGFDHRFDLAEVIKSKKTPGFVQGNFDQALLFLEPKEFKKQLLRYLEPFQEMSFEQRAPWVCGLGHGVLPQTPEDNVKTFVRTIREVFQ
ncbi:MAG: uroporphyrinogen decarboxylase family protein [Pseudobdellovibrionaceae bacterium]